MLITIYKLSSFSYSIQNEPSLQLNINLLFVRVSDWVFPKRFVHYLNQFKSEQWSIGIF